MSNLSRLVREGELTELSETLAAASLPEILGELARLDPDEQAVAFRLLDKRTALRVFEGMDPRSSADLLSALRDERIEELVRDLDPDDRARLMDELPASLVVRLLTGLDAHERDMTETVLGYPRGSAGRRMTPEVASVPVTATVGEALETLRRSGADVETIYMVPVLAQGRRLVGVVSLRGLLVADDHTPVADLASTPVAARTEDDQERAARLIRSHGMVGLPVVDQEDRLVGVITVDDAMRILAEEEAEDAARSVGTSVTERPYLRTPVLGFVKARIVWLLVLIVAATLTVNVLDFFEDTLAQVVALALFIPLLIGTGGNAGAQTVTTVVRAVSTDQVRPGDVVAVVRREVSTGLVLGVLLGLVGFVPAWVVAGPQIAVVLGLSLIAVCTLATAVGALIPLGATRLGVDPAVVSAPFITTVVDATGLVTYFLIATAVLGL